MKLLIFGALVAAGVYAGPITYTLTGTGTGTLTFGETVTPFTSQTYALTVTTDTSLLSSSPGPIFFTPNLTTVNFSVSGVGSGTATNMDVFDNQPSQFIGFQDNTTDNILGQISSFASSYNLGSALALTSGTPNSALSAPFSTSFGTVSFTSIATSSFSAATSAVPEPGSLVLSALGLVGLAYGRKRFGRAN